MPTPRGIAVAATAASLLAAGLLLGYRELLLLGAAGLALVLLAVLWVGAPPRLAIDRTIRPNRVRRDAHSDVIIDVHSVSGRTRVLEADDILAGPHGARRVAVPSIRVRGGTPARISYRLPTDRRGVFTVGPLRIGRTDALGLCSAGRRQGGTASLIVRPRVHPMRAVPVGVSPSLEGTVDAAVHGSITFHSLREYRIGDDLRHVHWRTSARVGQMMVREHLDTALPRVVVLLDDRAGVHDPEHFEQMCDAAASVLFAVHRADLPIELRLAGGVRAGGGMGAVLDVLAAAAPAAPADLAVAARRLRDRPAGDTVVLITSTGGAGGSDAAAVAALRATYSCVVVGVLGAADGEHGTTAAQPGVVVLAAANAADFARRWDRIRRWG